MIVAGFGFSSRAKAESLHEALRAALAGRDLTVTRLATASDKSDAMPIQELARMLATPVSVVADAALTGAEVITRSERAHAAYGTGSVAEASALVAAGPGSRLLGPRAVSEDRLATCALAEAGA